MSEMMVLFILAIVGIAGGAILSMLAEKRRERRMWSRYAHSGREPASIVCPDCHRRSYGERAVREKFCHACQKHHDEPARKDQKRPDLRAVA